MSKNDFSSVLPVVVQGLLQKLASNWQFQLEPKSGREIVPDKWAQHHAMAFNFGGGLSKIEGGDIDNLVLIGVLKTAANLPIIPNVLLHFSRRDHYLLP